MSLIPVFKNEYQSYSSFKVKGDHTETEIFPYYKIPHIPLIMKGLKDEILYL